MSFCYKQTHHDQGTMADHGGTVPIRHSLEVDPAELHADLTGELPGAARS